MKPRNKKDLKS